jgi:hypothetical protein
MFKNYNMKTIRIITICFLLLSCAAGLKAQQANKFVIPLSKPGQPYQLSVNANGPVTVSSYEGKEVIVETNSSENRIDNKNGLNHISIQTPELAVQENNNVVTIRSSLRSPEPGKEFSMNIKIPANLIRLTLRSMTSGNSEIVVNDVSGELEITNSNGGIRLNNISGSVVSSTLKGSIVATFRSVNPKAAMAFSALNGSIDVSLPQNLKANFNLRAGRGNISSEFDFKPSANVTRTVEKGLYRYQPNQSISASVNGGGPEIILKTITGNINIRKTK